jgi:2,4-dienoyl-CoA reductase-like NADH-dependent reductase (Old Yellow Enzyme family)
MNFPALFSPLRIGPYRLHHRVAMAPLTRMRAERSSFAPRELNESGETAIARGQAEAIAFGRIFISNPDLPRRLRRGFPLTPYNRATFYGGEAAGYTDYPVHDEL